MAPAGLCWSLVAQLTDEKFGVPTDVTFQFVDENDFEVIDADGTNEEVRAHKLILALVSQKFKDMFYNTSVSDSDVILIKNASRKAFAAMISFIYGSNAAFDMFKLSEVLELVMVAEEYHVIGLVEIVTEIIEHFSVNEDNLLETLKIALKFDQFPELSRMVFYNCAAYIKASVKNDNEIEEFIATLDEEDSVAEKLMSALTSLTPPPCSNCVASPCMDTITIPHTENMMVGCQVAVKNNNCPDHWGHGAMAQHGKVTKVVSQQTVRVGWCDGSESEYNVYLTDKKDDPQLVFHCGAGGA
eukprot:GFUD01020840.1.p1 GENE.GFUD01020840.1~~GFUD01020840.1.p1  ORF type:complete len:300 (-),score=101.27 GFUD01020840.1:264-1163(-)